MRLNNLVTNHSNIQLGTTFMTTGVSKILGWIMEGKENQRVVLRHGRQSDISVMCLWKSQSKDLPVAIFP